MGWKKIGVTTVVAPAAHGSGLYLRVKKDLVDAYDLWNAKKVEFTIERVKRPEPGSSTVLTKRRASPRKGEKGG